MTQPSDQSCSTCGAWISTDGAVGECHNEPPVPRFGAHLKQPGDDVPKVEFFWPETVAADWCRQWK